MKLIRRVGGDGTAVAAIDLTTSPTPKSVSVLWALGSDELRYELEVMVAKAADLAVMRMLDEQPFVRPRSGEPVRAEDFVAMSALHTTARISSTRPGVPDPQLHLHYLLIGALDRAQLQALVSKVLADYQMELDAEADLAPSMPRKYQLSVSDCCPTRAAFERVEPARGTSEADRLRPAWRFRSARLRDSDCGGRSAVHEVAEVLQGQVVSAEPACD